MPYGKGTYGGKMGKKAKTTSKKKKKKKK